MSRTRRSIVRVGLLCAALLAASLMGAARASIGDFDRALAGIPLSDPERILAAIEGGLEQPGFPGDGLLSLINGLASIPGSANEMEMILLLFARALENGMPIDGLLPIGFQLANALEEGLPIEGVLLEALKGIAQGSHISIIEAGISQRLTLLWSVRDLLFSRGVFRVPSGAPQTSPNAIPAVRFDELVDQIADALSDYLEGGGGPFDGQAMFVLVSDRLRRLPESVVAPEDVELVLGAIGPADLTQIALAALT